MGTSPAPAYATIYFGIRELYILRKYNNYLKYYKRYIDDVFGIWEPHPNKETNATIWREFQNDFHFGILNWEFSSPSKSIAFLDLTIKIMKIIR